MAITEEELAQRTAEQAKEKKDYMDSLGLTGIGFEKYSEHYTKNTKKGVIEHERVDYVFEDGVLLTVKDPHNQVLNPSQGDYDKKLADVTKAVQGTLAIQQNSLIAQKDAENVLLMGELEKATLEIVNLKKEIATFKKA